ncbi:uncharacterized protein [Mycetomoellerius zeteki]|uniref:uncharacterized protein n=1 Tax=Mycetomoellerius zeteki TaxID=64791 RepID=UPI00084ECF6A|nr:PREDICTED: uncharacterized protein LOC108729927 [Trachymyrmex zeteki]
MPVVLRQNEVLKAIPAFPSNLREVQAINKQTISAKMSNSKNKIQLPSISETSSSDDTFDDSATSFVSKRNNDKGLTSDRKNLKEAQDDQQISRGLQRKCSSCLQLQVKLEKISKDFETKLESVKRSILYDLNKKINELKIMMKAAVEPEIGETLKQREILPPLPMTTLEDFQRFETS